jgi:hypothetical protein
MFLKGLLAQAEVEFAVTLGGTGASIFRTHG